MSVTTVLVPVLEPEAEDLLAGHAPPELYSRAARLRREIGRIDAIREELHELLIPRWVHDRPKPRPRLPGFLRTFSKPEPPQIPKGYDPFVHLFGRSLPVDGATSKDVVDRLTKLLAMDDVGFHEALSNDLRVLDVRARDFYTETKGIDVPSDLKTRLDRLVEQARNVGNLQAAYNAIVTLSAWSRPVWRLDGDQLPDLVRTVGITVVPGRPHALFDELKEKRPDLEAQFGALPTLLKDFSSAATYWSSTDVKSVAGSLRLHRSLLAKNAVDNADDEATTLRNLRLLEEAVLFCEAENFGLAEAAGVEWHDRAR